MEYGFGLRLVQIPLVPFPSTERPRLLPLPNQSPRHILCDLRSVKTAVFDEYLVRVHAGHQDAGEIDACALAFERFRIQARTGGFGVERDAVAAQKFRIGAVTGHGEHEVVRDLDLAFRSVQNHAPERDFDHF